MTLGKVFLGPWYFVPTCEEQGKKLYTFLQNHSGCCKGLEEDTCGGISPFDSDFEPFELTYENRDDWGHQPTLQQKDKELHPDKYE